MRIVTSSRGLPRLAVDQSSFSVMRNPHRTVLLLDETNQVLGAGVYAGNSINFLPAPGCALRANGLMRMPSTPSSKEEFQAALKAYFSTGGHLPPKLAGILAECWQLDHSQAAHKMMTLRSVFSYLLPSMEERLLQGLCPCFESQFFPGGTRMFLLARADGGEDYATLDHYATQSIKKEHVHGEVAILSCNNKPFFLIEGHLVDDFMWYRVDSTQHQSIGFICAPPPPQGSPKMEDAYAHYVHISDLLKAP